MKIAIVGSRNYTDYEKFLTVIKRVFKLSDKVKDNITIISGGATGVDKMAERFARENNYKCIIHYPDWQKYGKAAGPKRNTKIVDELNRDTDFVIAFVAKKSVGTLDTIEKARNKKIQRYIYYIK